ncbi:MAG TPA: hypothetical protein VMR41_03040 [Patescibacteria group bacterium]|nr:hypothetical protein [Patescibacteria group bacterium]
MVNLLALSIPWNNPSGTPTVLQITPPSSVPTCSGDCLPPLLGSFITLLLVFSLLFALSFIIWGGFDLVVSQGDKTKFEKARNKIVYSIMGLILVLAAYLIINFVGSIFNLPLLNLSLLK